MSEGALHPEWENVPGYDDARVVATSSGAEGNAVDAAADRIGQAKSVYTIGVREGERGEMLGGIADVFAAENGTTYVLDEEDKQVKAYDGEGVFLWSFGREGEGPNEFMYPEALEGTQSGQLVVVGRMGKVKVFRSADTSFAHESTIAFEYTPEDMCVLDSTAYVNGYRAGKTQGNVQAYSLSGDHLRTFGEVYSTGNPTIKGSMATGHIACDGVTNTVAFVSTYVPVVYAYSPDGELKWRTRIEGYVPTTVKESSGPQGQPGAQYSAERMYDMMVTLETLPGGAFLAQMQRRTPKGKKKRSGEGVHTYVINAERGVGSYAQMPFPKVYEAAGDYIYARADQPFPQLQVFQVPEEGS